MILLGYIAALLIGVSLSLIGGGGSILTVPVLVYLFGVDPVQATAYSLFIVGLSSAVGAWPKSRQGLVDIRTAVVFGAPSIVAVFAVRAFLVPAIPHTVATFGEVVFTRSALLMTLFAVLMIAAAVSMIRDKHTGNPGTSGPPVFNHPLIAAQGFVVGGLTGLVGAGGGFLIVPTLVLLSRLGMKRAVGTSLLIIAAKSLLGFAGDLSAQAGEMDWPLLVSVTALALAGIFAGQFLSQKIQGDRLKKAFGWFALAMGLFVLAGEIYTSQLP